MSIVSCTIRTCLKCLTDSYDFFGMVQLCVCLEEMGCHTFTVMSV